MSRLRARHWWLLSTLWFVFVGCFWVQYIQKQTQHKRIQYEQERLRHIFEKFKIESRKSRPAMSDPSMLRIRVDALSKPRFTSAERNWARSYINGEMIRCGYTPVQQSFSTGINIESTKIGTLKNPPVLIMGAHYDTVQNSPGANDNASGVAALLDIACRLKTVETQFTFRFVFFDGEEQGMVGSKAYLRDHKRRQNIVGAIILEMLGSKCTGNGCQMWPKSTPPWMRRDPGDFIAIVGDIKHTRLMSAFAQSGAVNRPPIHTIPVSGAGHAFPDARRSDHSPFWDMGIDAVMVTDTGNFRYSHYHQLSDLSEHLNYEFMASVTDIIFDAIINIDHSSLKSDAVNPQRLHQSR